MKKKRNPWFRVVEKTFIIIFLFLTIVLVLFNPNKKKSVVAVETSNTVTAVASAMPDRGWMPLETYFSAFGSQSSSGEIVLYEWDLDGNGLYETTSTEKNGYTRYAYLKPGEYSVSLRVTDSQGNTATDSIPILVRHPVASSVDYWKVFDDSQVRRVEIQLTTANWEKIWQDPETKTEVPADAIVFGTKLVNVGFRMRGQFSLRESRDKKPWKINIDAYKEEQEYENLRQLMFINSIGDPSMLQEKLAYEMMYFAGIPSSHVAYVDLWFDFTDDELPPVFWGVYTMIERVDKKFLTSNFGRDSKEGNLYKASHAQRGPMDLRYYGEQIEDYPTQNGLYAYGKASNEEENDYNDIIELCRVIDGTAYETPEDFARAAEEVINMDTFLRYMAVVNTLNNWDSYPNTGNNFYLFNNSITGRFEWIPWDLTWGGDPSAPIFSSGEFGLVESAPLYDNAMQVAHYRVQYAAYVDLLTRYWFTYENILNKAKEYHMMIAPYVKQSTGDRMYYGENAMLDINEFDNSWNRLAEFTRERQLYIQNNLINQMEENNLSQYNDPQFK